MAADADVWIRAFLEQLPGEIQRRKVSGGRGRTVRGGPDGRTVRPRLPQPGDGVESGRARIRRIWILQSDPLAI